MTITLADREVLLLSADAAWDRQQWERLPADGNRYEVIGGVLYMSTAPSAFHQWILIELAAILREQLRLPGHALIFVAPVGVFMPGCDPVQPDIVVVHTDDRDIIHDRRIWGVPALLVEILSPSSVDYDLHTKRDAYALAGVPEYWAIRPNERDLLLHTDPDPGTGTYRQIQTIPPDGEVHSLTLPIHFTLATIFADAPDTTF